jgi:hypothetical protein
MARMELQVVYGTHYRRIRTLALATELDQDPSNTTGWSTRLRAARDPRRMTCRTCCGLAVVVGGGRVGRWRRRPKLSHCCSARVRASRVAVGSIVESSTTIAWATDSTATSEGKKPTPSEAWRSGVCRCYRATESLSR